MASLGIALPITHDSGDGFTMLKSVESMIKQNFKMLILTIPGERIMEPEFGIGLKRFLFSMQSENPASSIEATIRSQVKTYLPVVSIKDVRIRTDQDRYSMSISIHYSIPDIGTEDLLEITI